MLTFPWWFVLLGIHSGKSCSDAQDQHVLFKTRVGVLSVSLMPVLYLSLSQRGNIHQCGLLRLFPMACARWLLWKICQGNLLLSSTQSKWPAHELHSVLSHSSADLKAHKTVKDASLSYRELKRDEIMPFLQYNHWYLCFKEQAKKYTLIRGR